MKNCHICDRPWIDEEGHNPLCAHIVALDHRVAALERAAGLTEPDPENGDPPL